MASRQVERRGPERPRRGVQDSGPIPVFRKVTTETASTVKNQKPGGKKTGEGGMSGASLSNHLGQAVDAAVVLVRGGRHRDHPVSVALKGGAVAFKGRRGGGGFR